MKKALFLGIFALLLLVSGQPVFAWDNCQPIYGGGQSCVQNQSIDIQSFVQNPKTQEYVATLGPNDPAFKPDQPIMFKIVVHNTSTGSLSNVVISDTLPHEVAFVSGNGTFNTSSNTLTTTLGSMDKGATTTLFIEGKIQLASKVASQSFICPINQTMATANNNVLSKNNSQFCIQTAAAATTPTATPSVTPTGTLPPPPTPTPSASPSATPTVTLTPTPTITPAPTGKTTPATGPEMLGIVALLPMGAAGIFLRRKSK